MNILTRMPKQIWRFVLPYMFTALILALVACPQDSEDDNIAPTAVLDYPQSVVEGTLITLNGSDSGDPDGDELTYTWTQVSPVSPTVIPSNANTATIGFTAPMVERATTFVFRLTVTDADGASANVDARILVNDSADRPPTLTTPIGNIRVREGTPPQRIDLVGHFSDPDIGDTTIDYGASSDNEDAVTTDTAGNILELTFASDVAADEFEIATVTVTATDANDASLTATTMFNVRVDDSRIVNIAPIAVAGADQAVPEGNSVTLDGTASSDVDGDTLSYAWTQISPSSPTVTLTGAGSATASFTAPNVSPDTDFTFRLTVTDEAGATATDEVQITVQGIPNYQSSRVVDDIVTITFDEPLATNGVPNALNLRNDFTVLIDLDGDGPMPPEETSVDEVLDDSAGDASLNVNVGTAPAGEDIMTVSYSADPNRRIVDADNNPVASFTGEIVTNDANVFTKPRFQLDSYSFHLAIDDYTGEKGVVGTVTTVALTGPIEYSIQADPGSEIFAIDTNGQITVVGNFATQSTIMIRATHGSGGRAQSSDPVPVVINAISDPVFDTSRLSFSIAARDYSPEAGSGVGMGVVGILATTNSGVGHYETSFEIIEDNSDGNMDAAGIFDINALDQITVHGIFSSETTILVRSTYTARGGTTTSTDATVTISERAVPLFSDPSDLVNGNLFATHFYTNELIGNVGATPVTHYGIDGDTDGIFSIEPSSGNMRVTVAANRLTRDYVLTVTAYNDNDDNEIAYTEDVTAPSAERRVIVDIKSMLDPTSEDFCSREYNGEPLVLRDDPSKPFTITTVPSANSIALVHIDSTDTNFSINEQNQIIFTGTIDRSTEQLLRLNVVNGNAMNTVDFRVRGSFIACD